MKLQRIGLVVGILLLLALAVMPAQAFTITSLDMKLSDDGDAKVEMHYSLTLLEEGAVLFRISDPAAELKRAFDANTRYPVTVTYATGSSAEILIPAFAPVSSDGGVTTITSPSLSFEKAQAVLESYWFAPFISPDFSPEVTTITFPDGYHTSFFNVLVIPSVSHQLSGI